MQTKILFATQKRAHRIRQRTDPQLQTISILHKARNMFTDLAVDFSDYSRFALRQRFP